MVGKNGAPAPVDATASSGSEALQRLKRGELTLDQYLHVVVERNVAHIRGLVPSEQLEDIKGVLRAELASSPALIDLVRTATGLDPQFSDDLA